MTDKQTAVVLLENGLLLKGRSNSKPQTIVAPLASASQIVSHQEIITDPAYTGLALSFSMAQIGNVGAKAQSNESDSVSVAALLVKDLSPLASNWESEESFDEFLFRNEVFYVSNLDTRALALALSENGNMRAIISNESEDVEQLSKLFESQMPELSLADLHASINESASLSAGSLRVVSFDTGLRNSDIELFAKNDIELLLVPQGASADDIRALKPAGLFLGPGPSLSKPGPHMIAQVKELVGELPMLGVAHGHLLLGAALGAEIVEHKTSRYAANVPVQKTDSGKVEIVSVASRYDLDLDDIESAQISYKNVHDGRIEGIETSDGLATSVSFYPTSKIFNPANHEIVDAFFNKIKDFSKR